MSTENFESAMMHAERLREQIPEIYNPARVRERPFPPVVAEEYAQPIGNESEAHADSENEEKVDDENEQLNNIERPEQIFVDNTQEEEDVKPNVTVDEEDLAANNDLFNNTQSNAGSDSEEIDPLASEQFENGSNHSVSAELSKSMFNSVQIRSSPPIDAIESSTIDTVTANVDVVSGENNDTFSDESVRTEQVDATNHENQIDIVNAGQNDSKFIEETTTTDQSRENNDAQENEQARLAQIEANIHELLVHGQKVVIDHEVEYIHMPEQQLRGIGCIYRVKSNDILCSNKPFKENVCIF